jgi:hypothetical protein
MVLLLVLSCFKIPSVEGSGVVFPTTPILWPSSVSCLNQDNPSLAKEVVVGATMTVVVAAGDQAISDADWPDFDPGLTNLKNNDRNLLFGESCFWRSPNAPESCQGESCRTMVEIKEYSWLELAQIVASDCIPAGSKGCSNDGVSPGALSLAVIKKCQEVVFSGSAWFLTGPNGERAVMHATESGVPSGDVDLPPGWSLAQQTLTEDLVLHPYGEEGDCYYNILRDELVQTYHQIGFAGSSFP